MKKWERKVEEEQIEVGNNDEKEEVVTGKREKGERIRVSHTLHHVV